MANKFFAAIRARFFNTAADTAIDVGVSGDANPRVAIDAGGKISWGDGTSSVDTNLYRDSANVLKTDDDLKVGGKLSVVSSSGDEGGEINLALAQTNTTLNGGVVIDVYRNKLRFFEQGGSARGAYIDLTATSNSAGTDILAAGGASSLNELSDVTLTSSTTGDFLKYNGTEWVNDPINLGTDTTGNYIVDITGGTGVTVSHTPGEGSTPTISIGQAIGTGASPTFAGLTINGGGLVIAEGATIDDYELTLVTEDPTADRTITFPNASGTLALNGQIALGTHTTGNYVYDVSGGTGVTVTHTPAPGSTPSISIGQSVGTTSSVTFANVTINDTPTQTTHAATKGYVDSVAAGIDWHQAVKLATATVLPNSPSYSNGTAGVGATLTATSYARLVVDGANATTGDRVLVKNQTTASENGVYIVSEQGNTVDTYWVLTRATDFDSSPTSEIKTGEAVFVTAGNTNIRQGFVLTTTGTGTDGAHILNTDSLSFTQFTGTSAFTAGDGMTQSGNTLNVGTANSGRIVVNADNIDLATVAVSSSSGSATTSFISSITVDSYGRVTARESSPVSFNNTDLTGTPTAPTASVGTSTTQIATTAFVDAEIDSQAISKTLIDAKGDLIVGSADNSVARLAVGTNGYFLKANSAATNGVEWSSIPTINNLDDVGDVVITSAANGQMLVFDGTNWVNQVSPSQEPMGHENKADSTISFNNTTRVFTIQPVSSSYTVWVKGKRFVKTTSSTVTIPNTTGLYYIYFDSAGALQYQTTYFDWDDQAPTAYIYWNSSTSKAEFFADERHGVTLDWQTHEYLHRTRGAVIANGFGASNYNVAGDGSSDAHAKLDLADGTFFDEDLQVDITHSATPTANTWEQVLQGNAEIPVFYKSGTAWVKDAATEFPLKQGTSRPQYNSYSAPNWSTTDIVDNKFGISWVIATNNLGEPVIALLGQDSYNNIGAAEAVTWEQLNLDGFPVFEFRPLYKIVYQCLDAYTNSVNARFVGVYDLRRVVSSGDSIPTTPVSDHGSLTGLGDDDHTQYLHTTQTRAGITANIATTGTVSAANIRVGVSAAGELDTSTGNLTIDSAGGTVTVDDNLVVVGNLTVNGTTVSIDSTVTTIDDPVFTLGGDTSPTLDDNKDRGIEFRWHNGTTAKLGFFGYDDSSGKFTFIPDATNTSEVFSGSLGTIDVGDIHLSGTGSTGTGGVVRANGPTLTGTVILPTTTRLLEDYLSVTSSATLSLASHSYKVIEVNSSSNLTITVPTNSSEAFPVGTVITVVRVGTGEVTVSGAGGVTVNTSVGSRLRAQWSTATLRKRSTDTWLLSGDLKV